jgi:hypothetical protein
MGGEALGRMAEEEGRGRAERGDLRQREVDEDHVAAQDVQPEIRVDADQRDAGSRGQREEGEGVDHGARARTL